MKIATNDSNDVQNENLKKTPLRIFDQSLSTKNYSLRAKYYSDFVLFEHHHTRFPFTTYAFLFKYIHTKKKSKKSNRGNTTQNDSAVVLELIVNHSLWSNSSNLDRVKTFHNCLSIDLFLNYNTDYVWRKND